MKVTFLGTCSGTEPQPGRRHSSFVVERNGSLFWFDAGESCSYTAHLLGIDLLATRAIFISHTHMDHIGGLPNLLWTIRKLTTIDPQNHKRMAGRQITVHIPDLAVWDGVMEVLRYTQGDFQINFQLKPVSVRSGHLFAEDGFSVTAVHNRHMGVPEPGMPWRSYSYLFRADGKCVVYSGDVEDIREIGSLLDHCDLLLMETGHHQVEEICTYLKGQSRFSGQLILTHHGLAILADPAGELSKARAILGDRVSLAEDGMVIQVQSIP